MAVLRGVITNHEQPYGNLHVLSVMFRSVQGVVYGPWYTHLGEYLIYCSLDIYLSNSSRLLLQTVLLFLVFLLATRANHFTANRSQCQERPISADAYQQRHIEHYQIPTDNHVQKTSDSSTTAYTTLPKSSRTYYLPTYIQTPTPDLITISSPRHINSKKTSLRSNLTYLSSSGRCFLPTPTHKCKSHPQWNRITNKTTGQSNAKSPPPPKESCK